MVDEREKTRILWLSDIHLREEYLGKEYFINRKDKYEKMLNDSDNVQEIKRSAKKELDKINKILKDDYCSKASVEIKSFFERLVFDIKLIDSEHKIDYIIISGDLAFSGKNDEFELLQEVLLKHFRKIPLITIPGNHDCNWTQIPPKITEIDAETFEKRFKAKGVFLNDNFEAFEESFTDYTNFCKKYHYSEESKESTGLEYDYLDKSCLFGIIKDRKRKVSFTLLNSAWFCFGLSYNSLIEESYKNLISDNLHRLLKAKSLVIEQGGLIVGNDKISYIAEHLNDISDWFNVIIMHHPLHYLEYGEQYTYKEQGMDKISLHEILFRGDILLTGHEHLPMSSDVDIIHNKYVNLKAGMLLEDRIKVEHGEVENYPHNRFSIIDIFSNGEVIESRYRLRQSKDIKLFWEKDSKPLKIPKPKHREFSCSRPKIDKLILNERLIQGGGGTIQELIERYFLKHRGVELEKISDEEVGNLLRIDFKVKKSEIIFSFLVPLHENFTYNDYNEIANVCYKIRADYEEKSLHIGFFCLDLLVDNTLRDKYQKEDLSVKLRNYTLDSLEKSFSHWFDLFRHDFFNRKFEEFKGGFKEVEFKKIAQISFFYEIIPYWVWN